MVHVDRVCVSYWSWFVNPVCGLFPKRFVWKEKMKKKKKKKKNNGHPKRAIAGYNKAHHLYLRTVFFLNCSSNASGKDIVPH